MSLPTVSDSDRVALDELIGQALLCDDIRSELLSQDTRKDALKNAELSLNLWLRIMSFGDAQDIHVFAAWIRTLFDPPDTLM